MRTLIPLVAVLAGCAITPQDMAQRSNFEVCRFTMGGPHSQVAHYEAQRRGLDCAPLYPAIAAQQQREAAALSNAAQFFTPRQAPASRPTNCTSYRIGNTVQTECQ